MKNKIAFLSVAAILASSVAAPALAAPVTNSGDTKVSYNNSTDIIDPELDPEYLISVPAAIVFTEEGETIDADVEMTDLKGEAYVGAKEAAVSVKSKNAYTLVNGTDKISYTLTYNGAPMTADNKDQDIDTMDKDNLLVPGKATIASTIAAKVKGEYVDTLTYTVTGDDGATK